MRLVSTNTQHANPRAPRSRSAFGSTGLRTGLFSLSLLAGACTPGLAPRAMTWMAMSTRRRCLTDWSSAT